MTLSRRSQTAFANLGVQLGAVNFGGNDMGDVHHDRKKKLLPPEERISDAPKVYKERTDTNDDPLLAMLYKEHPEKLRGK